LARPAPSAQDIAAEQHPHQVTAAKRPRGDAALAVSALPATLDGLLRKQYDHSGTT
jgi:hypothetical protein